jgi:hypothetical protein
MLLLGCHLFTHRHLEAHVRIPVERLVVPQELDGLISLLKQWRNILSYGCEFLWLTHDMNSNGPMILASSLPLLVIGMRRKLLSSIAFLLFQKARFKRCNRLEQQVIPIDAADFEV